jgi:hypothetical protein
MPTDKPVEKEWLCPLYSFDSDSEVVDLAEGIQIKRMPSDLAKFLEGHESDLFWIRPSDAKWMLSLPYSSEAIGDINSMFEEWDRIKKLLFNVIIALRLCHTGSVTAGPVLEAKFSIGTYTFAFKLIITQAFELRQETTYHLSQPNALDINKLLISIRKLDKEGKLHSSVDTALRRFSSSYYGGAEDRLIDQMIAFESLYIGDNKELRYKLALRTAFLLGENKENVFDDMKKAYDLRSQIVHGNEPVDKSKLEETIPKTEEYLRQSIRKFLSLLSQGYSLKKLREKLLDENILKSDGIPDTE